MKNLTAWFMPNLIERMRTNIENGIPFDSDYQLWYDILSNKYVIEVTQFDVTELYSTSEYRKALEFIDNYDKEDKDIYLQTYDLTTYNYELDMFEPIL